MNSIQQLIEEYKPDTSIWNEDTPLVTRIKEIISYELDETDKRIILLYAELSSQRKVGKQLGVSTATINKKVFEIRNKIYDLLQHSTNSNDLGIDY